jgi:arginine exporter protein ArgO
MTESLVMGLWAGYGLALPVGAVAVLLVNTTAQTSFGIGASAAMGAVTADGVYVVAATAAGTALTAAVQPLADPLRLAAALILIAMAVRVVSAALPAGKDSSPTPRPASHLRSYLTFFGLTALNPWPAIYFGALVLGDFSAGVEPGAYVVGVLLASASWQLVLAAGGAVLDRALTGQRGQIITAMISGLLMVTLTIPLLGHAAVPLA